MFTACIYIKICCHENEWIKHGFEIKIIATFKVYLVCRVLFVVLGIKFYIKIVQILMRKCSKKESRIDLFWLKNECLNDNSCRFLFHFNKTLFSINYIYFFKLASCSLNCNLYSSTFCRRDTKRRQSNCIDKQPILCPDFHDKIRALYCLQSCQSNY